MVSIWAPAWLMTRSSVTVVRLADGSDLVTATEAEGDVNASFPPEAVSLTVDEPGGSARNRWRGTVRSVVPHGSAVRVPVPNVSLVDLTFTPKRDTSVDEVNGALKAASESGRLKGILAYTDEPLVSIDLNHNPASSTVDSLETAVLEGKLVRVVSWYDNEWGFSNRMVDTACAMAKLG